MKFNLFQFFELIKYFMVNCKMKLNTCPDQKMKKVHWTSLIECKYQPNSRKKLPMNSLNSTISIHQKGQHLALTDRVTIQIMRQQGQSLRQLPVPSTVRPPRSSTSLNAARFLCITANVTAMMPRKRKDALSLCRTWFITG